MLCTFPGMFRNQASFEIRQVFNDLNFKIVFRVKTTVLELDGTIGFTRDHIAVIVVLCRLGAVRNFHVGIFTMNIQRHCSLLG